MRIQLSKKQATCRSSFVTWQVGFVGLITSNEKEVDFLNSTKSSSICVVIPRLYMYYCYENVYLFLECVRSSIYIKRTFFYE